jgi:hypothetical protein
MLLVVESRKETRQYRSEQKRTEKNLADLIAGPGTQHERQALTACATLNP